ncbi:MAG: fumarate hydratase C-terminal domain-containing protein [Alicyclobacillus macrosporangiidus]|uniref:fumarate hydratase C-terminal domain-containing protein n=1 Tax=Alicyclobacillus macrosporangiidus TaxID=392015 RepID=UPI0026E9DF69|nr:fumarate hydratase C-terminal domain-containing protein [Alicyclobacillus macrosporangiidus]MCL6600159.1 fumarate hydratase C-terminal domain-containing protein [Alicyclobacillus macrosporangiidus]
MAHFHLHTPLTDEDMMALHVGDTVTLTGHMFGIRDANLIRIFDHGIDPPADLIPQLKGAVGIHTAPNVIKRPDGGYDKMCIGTTTSTRMDRFTPGLMERFGMKAIIGKGGQYDKGTRAIREFKGAYLSIVGGAAAIETTQIEEIEQVWWEDLMPECIWKFRIRNLGPLIVSIDCHGGSIYESVKNSARAKLAEIYEEMGLV